MSLRLTAPDQASVARTWSADQKAAVDSSSCGLLDFSIAKSREQSENVYENKRQVQNVAEQGSADLYLKSAAFRCDRGRTANLQNRSALHAVELSTWPYNGLIVLLVRRHKPPVHVAGNRPHTAARNQSLRTESTSYNLSVVRTGQVVYFESPRVSAFHAPARGNRLLGSQTACDARPPGYARRH